MMAQRGIFASPGLGAPSSRVTGSWELDVPVRPGRMVQSEGHLAAYARQIVDKGPDENTLLAPPMPTIMPRPAAFRILVPENSGQKSYQRTTFSFGLFVASRFRRTRSRTDSAYSCSFRGARCMSDLLICPQGFWDITSEL
jgi:hypothetical protein